MMQSVVGGEYLLTRALGWLANQYRPNESSSWLMLPSALQLCILM